MGQPTVDCARSFDDFDTVVFLTVAAFGAGRILGLDRYIEQLEVGGEPLVETFPVMRYLLG